jgi:hypothetical protein
MINYLEVMMRPPKDLCLSLRALHLRTGIGPRRDCLVHRCPLPRRRLHIVRAVVCRRVTLKGASRMNISNSMTLESCLCMGCLVRLPSWTRISYNRRLMNAVVQYPYYIPTTHERSLDIQPHLSYLPNHAHHAHSHPHSHGHGHEDHILDLRPSMVIPPPYHGQSMIPVHHHQPYALDGIVM